MRRFSALAAAVLATAMVAAGCGSDSSADTAVKVETGSLSKAEFVKRANAICESVRTEFLRKYGAFYKAHEPQGEKETEKLLDELAYILIAPYYGERMVNQIAALGAPEEFVPKVTAFLETLKQVVAEIEEKPERLSETAFPLARAEKAAEAAGLGRKKAAGREGCAGAFS